MSAPWYPWYPQDFRGDPHVAFMDWKARAALRELLDLSWGVGPIPDPEAALRAVGVPAKLWETVRPCWTETTEGWVQKRLEVERHLADERIEKASNAGRASARARAERKFNSRSNASSTQVDSESPSSTSSGPTNHNHNNTHSDNNTRTPPTGERDARARGAKSSKVQSPTRAQALSDFDAHLPLTAVLGLRAEVGRWYDALEARRKLWASQAALERHLRQMEARPAEAVEAVSLAADNVWTGLNHAYRELDRDQADARKRPRSTVRADGTRPGEPAEPPRKIREL